MSRAVVWFRRDLRLADHPALVRALDSADEVLPLVVLDPVLLADPHRPAAARYLACVAALRDSTDGALLVRRGTPARVVTDVAAEVGAGTVHVSGESTPYGRRRDERAAQQLADRGIELVETGTPYAVAPGRVQTGVGTGYQVFTPFYRAWRERGWRKPPLAPRRTALAPRRRIRGAARRRSGRRHCRRGNRPPALASVPRRPAGRLRQATRPAGSPSDQPRLNSAEVRRAASPHVACRHHWHTRRRAPRAPRPSSGSCAGGSSTPTCCGAIRVRRGTTCIPSWTECHTTIPQRHRPRPASTPGAQAAPAIRWSTPACASCSPRGGCTTGCGW